nr:uncharacterized protein LOC127323560 [Lolium perenne]
MEQLERSTRVVYGRLVLRGNEDGLGRSAARGDQSAGEAGGLAGAGGSWVGPDRERGAAWGGAAGGIGEQGRGSGAGLGAGGLVGGCGWAHGQELVCGRCGCWRAAADDVVGARWKMGQRQCRKKSAGSSG